LGQQIVELFNVELKINHGAVCLKVYCCEYYTVDYLYALSRKQFSRSVFLAEFGDFADDVLVVL